MVSSPMYERLKEFMKAAQANQGLDAWDTDHEQILKGFEESVQQLNAYRESHGFTGATGDAMDRWVDASIERIKWYQSNYARGYQSYEMGRQVMRFALAEAETISDDLLDAKTAAMRDDWVVSVSDKDPGGGIEFMGRRYTTGAAYVEAVEAQANAQREAAAARILEQMNSGTARMSSGMRIGAGPKVPTPVPTPDPDGNESSSYRPPDNWTGGTPPIWGGTSSNGYGRNDDRSPSSPNYPDGFNQPWWSEADAAAAQNRIVASGAVPTRELPYGELGSRTNPITDPQELMGTDLLHKSVNGTTYRNGVVGGHTPAPPADAHHPLWRLNGGGASDVTTSGRLGGAGVLGAGALGLRGTARMGSGSFGGSGSLGGSGMFGRFGGAGSSALGRFGGSGAGANGLGGSGSAGGLSGAGRMGAAGMRGVTGSTNGLGGASAAGLKVGSYSGSGFGSYTPPAGSAGAAGAGGANGVAGSSGVTGSTGANGGAAGAAGAAGKGGTTSGGFMGAGAGAGSGAGKDDKKGRKRQYVAFKFDDDEDALPPGYVNPLSQTSGTDKDITPAKRADDGWDPRQW
ncbi:hypothetical protein [Schaalia sp. ORNL0103]|uniref:hypothetical protein n=1 Tax=Schaalia sp. ORNL0103 TaxID=2789426 RepID=UPI001CA4C0E1|nr:hypothetical protein [Schaalia sp. ORNL0103]MBW6413650.1 hypothetical protein [Schaalia sp. ORNL0103]